MKKYEKKLGENIKGVIFNTYDDVTDWIKSRAKKYKSKSAFYASDEYRAMYPYIQKMYEIEKENRKQKAAQVMASAGVDFGDRVEYTYVSPFLTADTYTGTIINRNGIPYVKYDSGITDVKGRKSGRWHKGWKKI